MKLITNLPTPLHLNILLHHYIIISKGLTVGNAITEEYTRDLINAGLIDVKEEGMMVASKLGAAHIGQILTCPFPKQVFIDARGEVIHE